jgi:hypothetical protein
MKLTVLIALAMLALPPAFAQDQSSCKAFFQVVRSESQSSGLRTGMGSGQIKWWQSEGQKKYPGLCLDGSVTSGDKPRYLVILSKSKSFSQASTTPNEIYGQTGSELQASAPKEWIYQPRWNTATVTVLYVLYDGKADVPPVHISTGRGKALQAALKFLWQEPVFPAPFK